MSSALDGLRLRTRAGHPDFLDLPWSRPLDEWEHERMVEIASGLHRHVVVFVDYEGVLYALKQMPGRLVRREHRMLRGMADSGLPAVEAVGTAERAAGLEDVLVTRFLDYSLPYRSVLLHRRRRGADVAGLFDQLLDALAVLLVRLHLAGFFWGDCSLSNTLFRRDAGALAAYVVDVETGEWHNELTAGQRTTELETAEHNIAGGLFDLQAELDLPEDPDPVAVATDLRIRYERLWAELTGIDELSLDERYKVNQRVRRLNELGFDVEEIEVADAGHGQRLHLRPVVIEQGYHRRRLHSLTGLDAQENQARSLLNDLTNFRAAYERRRGGPVSEHAAAHRWLLEVFEPIVEAIPDDQRGKLEPVEVFHEIIVHKWFMSERAGRDVGVDEAARDYFEGVLSQTPAERVVLGDHTEGGYMGYG